jgi:hypothetical protein
MLLMRPVLGGVVSLVGWLIGEGAGVVRWGGVGWKGRWEGGG